MTRQRLAWVAVCCGLSAAATWPVFQRLDYWGRGDWDQHLFYQAVPRHTLLAYRQWPLWNPWYCGGMVMLANPQSRFLSPTFGLVLWLGPVAGVKAEIAFHCALCLLGGVVLARQFGLCHGAALAAAAAYGLCTMFAQGLAEGMTWLLACAYVPWALAFFLRSLRGEGRGTVLGWALACACAWVLMFFNGGAYPLAWTAFTTALYALLHGLGRGRPRLGRLAKPIGVVVLVSAMTFALAAVKLAPCLAYMHAHPRRVSDRSGYSLSGLATCLVARPGGIQAQRGTSATLWSGATWTREENASYVGAAALALALVGLVAAGRRHWRLGVVLGVLLWLSLGSLPAVSLWDGLRRCPVFDSMRVAQRARLLAMVCVALFTGFGVQALLRRGRFGKGLAGALLVVLVADLLRANACIYSRTFVVPPAQPKRSGEFMQISKLDDVDASQFLDGLGPLAKRTLSMLYPAFLCNLGTVDALESAATRRRPRPSNRPSYRGEAFVLGTEGQARIVEWSPNRVVVEAELTSQGQVVLNQNHSAGWRTQAAGSGARWVNGFVGCDAGPGRHRVTFTYAPASAAWGLWISAASAAVAVAALALARRRHRGRVDSGARF